jgi:hypothetical protein
MDASILEVGHGNASGNVSGNASGNVSGDDSCWFDASGIRHIDRVSQMKRIQAEALELFTRKNADYGDAFATFGLIGLLVRIEDKIKRALNIQYNQITLVEETLRDTLLDLHNYSAMALMLKDEPRRASV